MHPIDNQTPLLWINIKLCEYDLTSKILLVKQYVRYLKKILQFKKKVTGKNLKLFYHFKHLKC